MANKILDVFQKALRFQNATTISGQGGGWRNIIHEPFAGAWQQNQELSREDILAVPAIFSCITLISNDISKLGVQIRQKDSNSIWVETTNSAYSPVLRKPNGYQTRNQFFSSWVTSTLMNGNTYVLKVRDNRRVVVALYILDPERVTVQLSPSGDVFYELNTDLTVGGQLIEPIQVPASEIIHDRPYTFYHPLIGVSPLMACALQAGQTIEIQKNTASFFKNHSRPGGILTAPGAVSDETVQQLRDYWEANYTGNNAGKVAVLADGLTYKSFDIQTLANSQVVEQLKWTAEVICQVFHVPPYKLGLGNTPTSGNIESENIRYYSEALQSLIEGMEILLSEGLGMANDYDVHFNTDDLFRMDSKSLIETEEVAVGAGIKHPNEARKRLNLPPTEGGDTAYMQQQNYSLAALSKRDAKEDPFESGKTATPVAANTNDASKEYDEELNNFIRIKAAERFIHA